MQYLITFLEGVISFISPCMLPMLPLYISYFAGEAGRRHTLARAAVFVAGFTAVFTAMGLFAGTLGSFLLRWQRTVDIVAGLVVMLLGLSYLEIIPLPFFRGVQGQRKITGVFSALVFGMVYSVSLTPCVGAFLGSALMLASSAGGAARGALLLLPYSLGLGVPFLLSAALLSQLSAAFNWIKRHYRVINLVSGGFLVVMGLLMALGLMNRFLSLFA